MKQLNIPFGISPGCEPYFDEFLLSIGVQKPEKPEEICKGGLVFPVGQKDDCRKCASTCKGCVEMVINLGYGSIKDLGHLVQRPEMLLPKFREAWKNI